MTFLCSCLKVSLALLVVCVLGLYMCTRDNYASVLEHEGERIFIQRDEYGIASSAMYGWGYVSAQDRLFQMSFRRVLAKAKLSEYIGQKGIEVDKMLRELNFNGWSERTEQRFKQQNLTEYQNFQHYATGINDYVGSLTLYPVEFYLMGLDWQEWKVGDIISMYKLLKWSQSQNVVDQYIRSSLLKHLSKEQVDLLMPYQRAGWVQGQFATLESIVKEDEVEDMWKDGAGMNHQWSPVEVNDMLEVGLFNYIDTDSRGSNSWVIGGQHTESGHPILTNDPHLDSALPGEWYQIRIYYTHNQKQHKIVGGALAGVPIFIGQTNYLSCAVTTIYGDSQDLYKQTINYQNNSYLFDGEWRQLHVRNQSINVKGGQTIHYPVYETHHGPIINFLTRHGTMYELEGEDIALCWAGFIDGEFDSLAAFSHAAEYSTYDDVLSLIVYRSDHGPPLNYLYITQDDHIGYQMTGPHPLRRHPHMGMYVKDGSNSKNDWTGFVRDEEKLHLRDPPRGYIVTANNKPGPASYQHALFQVSMYTGRADRIEQMIKQQLQEGRKFTKADMKRMLADTTDLFCMEVVAAMRKKVQADENKYRKVFGQMVNFDCNFSTESTTATIYLTFLKQTYELVHPNQPNKTENLGSNHPFLQYLYRYIMQAETESQIRTLQTAITNTYAELEQFFQTSDRSKYRYGDFHKDRMIHRPFGEHPLLKHIFEQTNEGWGNWNTPNVGLISRFHHGDLATYHRANIRNIMSHHEESQWIVDAGVSEKVFSKHYKDQLSKFLNNQYILMQPKNQATAQDL